MGNRSCLFWFLSNRASPLLDRRICEPIRSGLRRDVTGVDAFISQAPVPRHCGSCASSAAEFCLETPDKLPGVSPRPGGLSPPWEEVRVLIHLLN
ncbi:hypothetical protein SRHO_G00302490 [Serrasalmus rhombeus]